MTTIEPTARPVTFTGQLRAALRASGDPVLADLADRTTESSVALRGPGTATPYAVVWEGLDEQRMGPAGRRITRYSDLVQIDVHEDSETSDIDLRFRIMAVIEGLERYSAAAGGQVLRAFVDHSVRRADLTSESVVTKITARVVRSRVATGGY